LTTKRTEDNSKHFEEESQGQENQQQSEVRIIILDLN